MTVETVQILNADETVSRAVSYIGIDPPSVNRTWLFVMLACVSWSRLPRQSRPTSVCHDFHSSTSALQINYLQHRFIFICKLGSITEARSSVRNRS
jgi:hypothetical protein